MNIIKNALEKFYANKKNRKIIEFIDIYVKFADTEPKQNTEMYTELTESTKYVGFAKGVTDSEPKNYTDYNWVKIKGQDKIY